MKSSLNLAILCSIFIFHVSWMLIEGQRFQSRPKYTIRAKCHECGARDCDNDRHCRQGLLCADPRKTYCAKTTPKNWELCYDPKKDIKKCNNDTACSDGNACNGIELCNMTTGVCRPGPALDCDDKNLCTTDACDIVTGCIQTPIVCGVKEACDRLTGTCEVLENFRHAIAVIDESDSQERTVPYFTEVVFYRYDIYYSSYNKQTRHLKK